VSVGGSAIGEGSSSIMSSFSGAGGTLVRRDMGEESQRYIAGRAERKGRTIRIAAAISDD